MKIFSVFFCLFVFAAGLFAAPPVNEDSWALAAQGDDLALSLTLPDNAHAYEASTGPVLPDGVAPITAPAPKQEKDAVTGELDSFYVGPGVLTWILPKSAAVDGKLKVKWQVCVGEMCYMPGSAELAVPGSAASSDETKPSSPETEAKKDNKTEDTAATVELLPFELVRSADGYLPAEKFLGFLTGDESKYSAFTFAGKGFLMMLLLAILGGIALNLTPCVLPLLPVNLAMIGAGQASGNGKLTRVWHGMAYGAGIMITYGLLGVVSVLMGTTFGGIDSSWIFNAAVAVIFVVLALAMFDLFSIDFSGLGSAIRLPESAHFGGIFLMGALSAVLAGACVAPVLAAALVQAAKMVAHGDYYGLALPFALGFGMALPWPVAAAGIGLFPKPGRWMMRVKQLLGVFILGLAAYYAWTAWTLFADGRAEAAGMASAQETAGAAAEINAALKESAATGRPVLLDFTAAWCKNCKAMELSTFQDPGVKAAMDGMIFLKVHADKPSAPETAALMKAFDVPGLPAYRIIRPAD
ncbi:MAG: thioredoxin family protein [Lentisphaeria bacterium]|nr:thioredoxin family protein [Lentisphaeria bacterium]